MISVIGLVVLLVMVFGGFALAGGNLLVIMAALPLEMLIIGGAAAGATLVATDIAGIKQMGAGLGLVVKGPKYKKADYSAAIFLTARLMKMFRTEGAVAVEPHIEDPKSSSLFAEYPQFLKDPFFLHLLCDSMRLLVVSTGTLSPQAVDDVIETALDTHHAAALKPCDRLTTMSDALPALGIVAAVLGVIKTMASIDKPPAILGGMIGSALVGTFLGVLLSYGIVGPLSARLRSIIDADAEIYLVIRRVIVASLKGQPQPLVIEAARTAIDPANQPSFAEVFDGLRAAK
ncbi:flagellar motor protein MotA [Polymorphobacter multimanifer]|uniref:Chemotaxis protein MotA n=1 Tax=Polymorphobacter multimanifer TaxID=1070431 RepID=A0A841L201_9SPHN|nr:flagellar motor stator protein MotA [Polymorphobacter multimanifer]MBB6226687.1 chemotaxis protein MotA [Polymorphobacter multimanifer]GGI69535.1 flagellar motor protein MotA [Polymorphobacter multimanifer]